MTPTDHPPMSTACPPHARAWTSRFSAVADELVHVGDVGAIVDTGARRWTDALAGETRAQLAGCLNAVEIALQVELADGWLAAPLATLTEGHCRVAIERQPALLSPVLLDHLRRRAAAALMLRLAITTPPALADPPHGPSAFGAPFEAPATLIDALTAFRLTIEPWLSPAPAELPIRPDLAAEPYCDLVWTAAALILDGLVAVAGVDAAAACPVLARAAQVLIGRHDEEAGPFARAAYVAAIAGDAATADRLAHEAAIDRQLLLVAALGAARAGMGIERALALLIDGGRAGRGAFARLLSLPVDSYAALLAGFGPVTGDPGDADLPRAIDEYRLLDAAAALRLLMPWRGPEGLVAKLARLDRAI